MADYPVGINVGQKSNWRFGNLNTVTEAFTVPNTSPGTLVRFPLSEYPFEEEPSNFVIAGMTEVTTAPASATEFRVLYDYAHIEFYQGASEVTRTVQYSGNGSIIKAGDFNRVVNGTHNLARVKMFNAVPLSGGIFTFDSGANTVVVSADIDFLFPLDVGVSFGELNSLFASFIVEDGSLTINDDRFIIAVIQDTGVSATYGDLTWAQVLSYAATSVVCPLFYRNGDTLIALWSGAAIGNGQSIGPTVGAEGGGLTLDAVTDNGATTTNNVTVGDLTATGDVLTNGSVVLIREGVGTWSAVLDTETLSTNLTYLLPDYNPLDEGPVLALRSDVTLAKMLAAGNVTTEELTVGGLYSTGDVEVDGALIINGTISGSAFTSGTYTPTITSLINIEGSAPTPSVVGTFKYIKVGNIVQVTGKVNLRPSLFAQLTEFNLSLPSVMGANFSSINQANGVVTSTIDTQTGVVSSVVSSQTIKCSFQTSRDYKDDSPVPDPVAVDIGVSFMYEFQTS